VAVFQCMHGFTMNQCMGASECAAVHTPSRAWTVRFWVLVLEPFVTGWSLVPLPGVRFIMKFLLTTISLLYPGDPEKGERSSLFRVLARMPLDPNS